MFALRSLAEASALGVAQEIPAQLCPDYRFSEIASSRQGSQIRE
jgi:hypothetical protein